MLELNDVQQNELLRALEKADTNYDPAVKMLAVPLHGPGYHTTLKNGTIVHPTRDSAEYAVALLDSGEEWRRERAIEILDVLVALQDQNPEHDTYGIWSWFQDEPLTQMSPPDWNWADFMGTQLLQVVLDHRQRIPAELAKRIDEAIVHAAHSIIRRNVTMAYTNIAIMGTYVTYVAAELYKLADLQEYADNRLHRFYNFTKEKGGYPEFNSPTYTIVAITELTRMLKDIRNEDARKLVTELYEMAWHDVATHFHVPTRQWAGPHSRCYSTLLQKGTLAYLQRAIGDSVSIFPDGEQMPASLDAHRIPAHCPEKFQSYFAELTETRNHVQTFFPRVPPAIGYTHLNPTFTLGSINYSIMWNQCRPIVAYWNSETGASALQVRFLHDGYDYSSANIVVDQHDADLLAAICFATDGGDTHCGLDKLQNATIQASDMRLRIQLFNVPESYPLPTIVLGKQGTVNLGEVTLAVNAVDAVFADYTPSMEVTREDTNVYLDVVLYKGERRPMNFNEIAKAACVFALSMRKSGEPVPAMDAITVQRDDEFITASWPVDGKTLSTRVSLRPRIVGEIEQIANSTK